MQSDQQYHPCGEVMNTYEHHEVGFNIPANNAVGATNFPLGLQPPENYLDKFIIFNQNVDRSPMMYHPVYHPVFPQPYTYPGFNNAHPLTMENNVEKEISSSFTEDSDEINALLSLDNEQEWESEEEEVSTARTNGYDGSSSPDSSCNYVSKSKKTKFSSSHGAGSSSCNNSERKKKKMQKMVSVLRGIVPGGQTLSTTAVLDEAVKYLKSLKVEVEKNGVDDTKHHS